LSGPALLRISASDVWYVTPSARCCMRNDDDDDDDDDDERL
jgi:hypothetical protein